MILVIHSLPLAGLRDHMQRSGTIQVRQDMSAYYSYLTESIPPWSQNNTNSKVPYSYQGIDIKQRMHRVLQCKRLYIVVIGVVCFISL